MAARLADRVLLVGWGGADWDVIRPLLARGHVPHLRRLIDGGASGTVAAPTPLVPPMLWTSAATGKRGHKHGIHGYAEPTPAGDGVRAASSTSRTSKALWNILSQAGLRTHVINWPASHPAEPVSGVCVSDAFAAPPRAPDAPWPVPAGSVHPPDVRQVMADLRLRPDEIDRSMLLPLVPRAAEIDQARDRRLLACAAILAEAATAHAAATWCLEHRPWDFAAVHYGGIEQSSRLFIDYHSPKAAQVSDVDAALYGGVVEAVYRFHDLMLGRLLQLAGPGVAVLVVSDHGYRAGGRGAPVASLAPDALESVYRPRGVAVLNGRHVRAGHALEGAGLLDVAPTVLTLFGLPAGADMDGRPWVEALDAPVETDRVMSWEAVAGDDGRHPPAMRVTPAESIEAARHLVELGYILPGDEPTRRAVERAENDNAFNLARSLIDAGRPAAAIDLLEPLARDHPGRAAYGQALFEAYYTAGRTADCRRLVDAARTRGDRGPLLDLAAGAVELADRRPEAALRFFDQAARTEDGQPALHVLIGRACLRLRQWDRAAESFRRALTLDADAETAWHGLACAALGRGEFEAAAEHALHAIALKPDYAEAHYHLGVALARLGRPNEAAGALRRALALGPSMLAAYGRLIELCAGPLADAPEARRLRREAEQLILRRRLLRREARPAPAPGC